MKVMKKVPLPLRLAFYMGIGALNEVIPIITWMITVSFILFCILGALILTNKAIEIGGEL